MARKTIDINPEAGARALANLNIPYTVYSRRFDLMEHVETIECSYQKGRPDSQEPTIVYDDDQIAGFRHMKALADPSSDLIRNVTMSISSMSSIAYPEAVAAELALEFLARRRIVCWVNVSASLSGQRELVRLAAPYQISDVALFVFTGLRWDGAEVRFDKTFDLLRETHREVPRIIVGCGADPLSIARRMDVPAQLVLNVGGRTVQM